MEQKWQKRRREKKLKEKAEREKRTRTIRTVRCWWNRRRTSRPYLSLLRQTSDSLWCVSVTIAY
jgi:hypothetical protein